MIPAEPPPPPALPIQRVSAGVVRGDPLTATQDHLAQINWTPPRPGGRRPIVAVLDTGVDPTAPDLAGVVMTAAARSFVPGNRDATVDPEGHGTHLAGIIAARSGNGTGGSGVAAARILPVTIADAQGRTTTSSLVRGVRYATARGARVINISFGGTGASLLEQEAIEAATRQGALVVVAVGNGGGRGGAPGYPGAYRHVMAVAALGAEGRALPISERGPQVAIAAPGEDVRSVAPRGPRGTAKAGLVARTGTSMAAAIVTGAAARLFAQRPALSAQQVRAILESTAHDVPPSGPDLAAGAGALDLKAALAAPTPSRGDREPNDEIALTRRLPALLGADAPGPAVLRGRTGAWSDPRDLFRVPLRAGETLTADLAITGATPLAADLDLLLWRPGTPSGRRGPAVGRRWLAAASLGPGADESLRATASTDGVYTVEVRGLRGAADYALTVRRDVTVRPQGVRGAGAAAMMGRG